MTDAGMRGRSGALDLMKAAAIVMVLLYHTVAFDTRILELPGIKTYAGYLTQSFLCLCVPVFFFVHGALSLPRPLDVGGWRRKLFQLPCLILFWGFLTGGILLAVRGERVSPGGLLLDLLSLKQGLVNHLWFLCALFAVTLIFPLCKLAFDAERRVFLVFFGICVLFTIGNYTIGILVDALQSLFSVRVFGEGYNFFGALNPFLGSFGYALAYFLLGGLMFEKRSRLQTGGCRAAAAGVLLLSILLLFLYGVKCSQRNGVVFDVVCSAYNSPFAFAATGAFFVLCLPAAGRSRLGALVRLIGQNTLGIYLIHWILIGVAEPLTAHLSCFRLLSVRLLWTAVLLAVSLGLSLLLRRLPLLRYAVSLSGNPKKGERQKTNARP